MIVWVGFESRHSPGIAIVKMADTKTVGEGSEVVKTFFPRQMATTRDQTKSERQRLRIWFRGLCFRKGCFWKDRPDGRKADARLAFRSGETRGFLTVTSIDLKVSIGEA